MTELNLTNEELASNMTKLIIDDYKEISYNACELDIDSVITVEYFIKNTTKGRICKKLLESGTYKSYKILIDTYTSYIKQSGFEVYIIAKCKNEDLYPEIKLKDLCTIEDYELFTSVMKTGDDDVKYSDSDYVTNWVLEHVDLYCIYKGLLPMSNDDAVKFLLRFVTEGNNLFSDDSVTDLTPNNISSTYFKDSSQTILIVHYFIGYINNTNPEYDLSTLINMYTIVEERDVYLHCVLSYYIRCILM